MIDFGFGTTTSGSFEIKRKEIDNLIEAKINDAELDRGPQIPAISRFIEEEMKHLQNRKDFNAEAHPSMDLLNELFRNTLEEVWKNCRSTQQ
jgi:predicted nucleotidyltransferase